MKKIVIAAGLLVSSLAFCQQQETFEKKGKVLIFTNHDPNLNKDTKKGLVKTFFKVYPKLVKDFNPESMDTIRVKIDTEYDGVAYAHNGRITISSDWLAKKPGDLDVITHEVMHIVQSYPPNSGPGWLTEGIADYVRFKYGVDNQSAGWSLPDYKPENSYKNSYRITARFLYWLTKKYDKNIVQKLDKNMRNKTYSEDLWNQYTGKSLDALWAEYSESPQIS